MASWMIHLRIAEEMYKAHPILKNEAFVVGHIAPDSGVPSPDGGYVPDGDVTHFRLLDENGLKSYHGEMYIEKYLPPEKCKGYSLQALSFHIAYAAHLLTDRLWVNRVVYPARARFSRLFSEDRDAFHRLVKGDWYLRDFLYLKNRPDFEAYEIYKNAPPFKNTYVEFYTETAVEERKEYIVSFYEDSVKTAQERETYISPQTLDAFVSLAANEALDTLAPVLREVENRFGNTYGFPV